MVYGALLSCIITLIAVMRVVPRLSLWHKSFRFDTASFIKILFVGCIAVVYGPLLLDRGAFFKFPDIYDLAKQISSLISVASAKHWPTQNPWFPERTFAYNLLYYAPLGYLCRLQLPSPWYAPVFCLSLLWTAWHGLGVLQNVLVRLKLPVDLQNAGLLFATFVSGLSPVILRSDIPIGFLLHQHLSIDRWIDDPFVSFVYVPQHLFAIFCILSAWSYSTTRQPLYKRLILQLVLFASGVLCSYTLAPAFILIFFVSALVYLIWEYQDTRKAGPGLAVPMVFLIYLALFVGLCLPFILEANAWAGDIHVQYSLHLRSVVISLFTHPLIFFPCLLALGKSKVKNMDGNWVSYLAIVSIAIFFFFFINYPDSHIKSGLFLRILLIPIACYGLYSAYKYVSKYFRAPGVFLLGSILVYFCLLSIVQIGYFITTSYNPRPVEETKVINFVKKLPITDRVWIKESNQELAAAVQKLTLMDFYYRPDRYLPRLQRDNLYPSVEKINHIDFLSGKEYKIDGEVWRFLSSNVSVTIFPSEQRISFLDILNAPVLLSNRLYTVYDLRGIARPASIRVRASSFLENRSFVWQPWHGSPQNHAIDVQKKLNPPRITSLLFVDSGFISPVRFDPGVYRLTAYISGQVEGPIPSPGHVSLHGVRKLLKIPPGVYKTATKFSTLFRVPAGGFQGHLAFGLGGWGEGRGSLQLNSLQIERLESF